VRLRGRVVPALRTLLASLPIVAGGLAALHAATDGFQAFTSETARRLSIARDPRLLPQVPLEAADGSTVQLGDLRGRWLLVDFIYTRCETYCSVQGNEFARLQQRLGTQIQAGQVQLVSISFDPAYDDPAQLAAYQRRSGDRGSGWIVARPVQTTDLPKLLATFGVKAVPDGLDGYVHNAAISIVNPEGRVVAVLDWDAMQQAQDYVLQRVAP